MNTIKLNNLEMTVESYNKNTYLNGETITSNGNCNVVTSNITALNALMQETIDTIKIFHDEEVIYNLTNADAHITSITEYLNGDRMSINLNFSFQDEEPINESNEIEENSEEEENTEEP